MRIIIDDEDNEDNMRTSLKIMMTILMNDEDNDDYIDE